MSLFDDLVSINNSLSATLQGINSLLPFEAETLKDAPPIIEVAIGSARQEGEESGYDIGYDVGYGNAASIIVSTSNEVIEKYTTPVEDWSELPSKIDEVYGVGVHDGKLSLLESSKYMRGNAEGEVVPLRDVSPVEHTVGVEVFSKNLANLSNPRHSVFSQVVEQTENTITIEATATGRKWLGVFYALSEDLVGKTLTISGTWEATNANVQNALRVQWVNSSNAVIGSILGYINASGRVKSFTVTEKPSDAEYLALIVYAVADSANAVSGDRVVFSDIQLEIGNTKTAFTPHIEDVSAAKVLAMGKNILPFPYKDTTKTLNGITWTVNADGTITANGTASGDSVFQLTDTYIYNNGLHCRISGCPTGGSADTYYLYSAMTGYKDVGSGTGVTIMDSRYWNFRIYIKNGYTANNLVFKPQIELGTKATEYEPYKGAEYEQGEPIASISPNMTVTTDTDGAAVSVEYLRDIDLYIDSLITGVALSGGE